MPTIVVKGSGSRPWKAIDQRTGKVVGTSETKKNAHIFASKRDASDKKKGK